MSKLSVAQGRGDFNISYSFVNSAILQTLVRLTTRQFGNIAPVREKGCLNVLYAAPSPHGMKIIHAHLLMAVFSFTIVS